MRSLRTAQRFRMPLPLLASHSRSRHAPNSGMEPRARARRLPMGGRRRIGWPGAACMAESSLDRMVPLRSNDKAPKNSPVIANRKVHKSQDQSEAERSATATKITYVRLKGSVRLRGRNAEFPWRADIPKDVRRYPCAERRHGRTCPRDRDAKEMMPTNEKGDCGVSLCAKVPKITRATTEADPYEM